MGRKNRSYGSVAPITAASFGLNSDGSLFQLEGVRGPSVTQKSALGVPAVLNAVQALSQTISTLPFGVFAPDSTADDTTHPVWTLFNTSPNPMQTPQAFRAAMVVDMLCHGVSVSEVVRNGRGTPTELWRIDPGRVTITMTGGRPTMRVDGLEFDPADLLYVLYLSADGLTPASPLLLCRDSLSLSLSLEKFGAAFFRNGARPGGMLLVPPGVKPEDKKNAKENWEAAHGGLDNANRTAVMPTGYDYKPFQVSPDEGQFNETRESQVQQVQRILNVPGHVVKNEKTDIYTNYQHVNEDYVRHTLRPIAVCIEQAVEKAMGDGWQVEHDFEALLRGSHNDQAQYLSGLVGANILTPNEARAKLGMGPKEGGDVLVKSTAMNTTYPHENQPGISANADAGNLAG